ncbi:complex I subunit 5 family protein [Helicovermis profundi]|uniref:Complex I subunit 5 family protein n=1 Tax=Helicovermis profundi TaxID=3065157 RepID=A0AAU9EBX7_9FIRM|nr:complex I subunit 5 family protein [Clostridia bacterium S502]
MTNPVLLIVIPLLMAFLSIALKKSKKTLLFLAAIFNVLQVFIIQNGNYIIGGFKAPYGINLNLDSYSHLAVISINILFLLVIVMSSEKINKYSTVLLVSLAGLNGMLLTGDLFNLFVFLEIVSITAYILSTESKKYKYSFNYLTLGTLGSGLYLFGLIVLYAIFGSLNMADISSKMVSYDANKLIVPMMLIFVGLAVEAKLLPFNGWAKGVYGNTNSLIGALFASVYAGTILFVFGRVFGQVLLVSSYLKGVLIVIGLVTLIAGEASAFSKTKLREILVFSSIAQSGLVALLFVSGLIFPAVLQLLNNIIAKAIMFTVAGRISDEAATDDVDSLKGLFAENKLIGFAFTVSALSLIGLPLFYGFYSKINLLLGLFSKSSLLVAAFILLATIVEGAYFIRLLVKLWDPGEEGKESNIKYITDKKVEFDVSKKIIVFALSLIILLAGIYPSLVKDNLFNTDKLLNEDNPSYMFNLKGGM